MEHVVQVAVIVEITYRSSGSTSTLCPVHQVVTDNIKINTLRRRRSDVGILSRATECVLDVWVRLWAGRDQPITETAVRLLVEIDDICGPAIDREITGTAGGNISDARRRPTEQVLRMNIVPIMAKAGTKTNDLVHFVLRRALGIQIAGVGRPGELISRRGIECNNSIVWSALAD